MQGKKVEVDEHMNWACHPWSTQAGLHILGHKRRTSITSILNTWLAWDHIWPPRGPRSMVRWSRPTFHVHLATNQL